MKVGIFIVGAPKSGTTSLYYYLNEHPEILMSSAKEPDYFSDKEILDQGLYYGKSRIDSLIKYNNLFSKRDNEKFLGDASVSYLFYPEVSNRIKEYNPESKIIIMLRDPIHRAFSHYLMDYRLGLTSKSFVEEFNNQESLNFQQHFLLGNYYNQVKKYLEVFETENVHIIWYSDFKQNTEKELQKVIEFIGLNTDFKIDFNKVYNSFSMPKNNIIRKIYSVVWIRKTLTFIFSKKLVKWVKSILFNKEEKPKLSEKSREVLFSYYKSDIEDLEQLLSVNLSRWKK
ncbi:MAG: sulfotransferase [Flavobacteriales bacterium]|nr:sulfotransferase [Flavobacteriales bacterium]